MTSQPMSESFHPAPGWKDSGAVGDHNGRSKSGKHWEQWPCGLGRGPHISQEHGLCGAPRHAKQNCSPHAHRGSHRSSPSATCSTAAAHQCPRFQLSISLFQIST